MKNSNARFSVTPDEFDQMPREAKLHFFKLVKEYRRRESRKRIFHLFPDETHDWNGETFHARALYAPHMEFVKATADYMEVAFMAGNRCITPWTWIETPDTKALAGEYLFEKGGYVRSWDGARQCDRPIGDGILKSIEPAFRVLLDNGEFFDCSRKHRVLTSEGWASFDRLAQSVSGLRLNYKPSSYQANCEMDGYLGDRPLHQATDSARPSLLRRACARQRSRLVFDIRDAGAQIRECIRACLAFGPRAIHDDRDRIEGLFLAFSGAACDTTVLRMNESIRIVQQFRTELSRLAQQDAAEHRQELTSPSSVFEEGGALHSIARHLQEKTLSGLRSAVLMPRWKSFEQWFGGGLQENVCLPFEHLDLAGGRRIVAIVPIGLQPIIDASVPGTQNYFAGGVIHHNTGKSETGTFCDSTWLTGLYPDWWDGRRFDGPVRGWVAGKTNETVRDILQDKLLGEIAWRGRRKTVSGTGMIPGECIDYESVTWRSGVQNLVDTVRIKHVSGGYSMLGFKSYAQGRSGFEGTAQHFVHLDEEPPQDIYSECMTRLATTRGVGISTFTPLNGLTEVAMGFMPQEMRPDDG